MRNRSEEPFGKYSQQGQREYSSQLLSPAFISLSVEDYALEEVAYLSQGHYTELTLDDAERFHLASGQRLRFPINEPAEARGKITIFSSNRTRHHETSPLPTKRT